MTTNNTYTNLTVGEIMDALADVPRDTEIHIEEHVFYRWKPRGPKLLALELNTLEEVRGFEESNK